MVDLTLDEAKTIMADLPQDDPEAWKQPEVKDAADIVLKAVDEGEQELETAKQSGLAPDDAVLFDVDGKGSLYVTKNEIDALSTESQRKYQAQIAAVNKAKDSAVLVKEKQPQESAKQQPVKDIKTPLEYFGPAPADIDLPIGASAMLTATQGRGQIEAAEIEMKRFGKSFVPGWLTIEDWKSLTPLQRAVSIAGDIGQTILYLVPAVKGTSYLIGTRPASNLKGTFPNKGTGLKVLTKNDLKTALKEIKQKEFVSEKSYSKLLKKTVDIKTPVEMPLKTVTVVKEGPAGARFLNATDTITPPKGTLKPLSPTGGRGITARPELLKTTGGGTKTAPIEAGRMTVEQYLRLLSGAAITVIAKGKPIPKTTEVTKTTTRPDTVTKTVQSPVPSTTIKPEIIPTRTPKPAPGEQKQPVPEFDMLAEPSAETQPKSTPKASPEAQPLPGAKDMPAPALKPTAAKPAIKEIEPKIIRPLARGITIPDAYPRKVDFQRRRDIRNAKGAIAWRNGELHGKDRWDVITSPYTDKENYTIVLGKKPLGAIIVKGPGSAKKTAQLVFGTRLKRRVLIDQPGLFTTELTPGAGKQVRITFFKDVEISKPVGSLDNNGKVFPL